MSDFTPPPLPPEPPPPSSPAPPDAPQGAGIPWDERDRIGFASAFVETIKRVLLDPVPFFRAMPTTGGLTGPLLFGIVVAYFGLAVSVMYRFVFQSIGGHMLSDFGRSGEFNRVAAMMASGFGLLLQLVLGPLFVAMALFVGSAITHLCLMLLGGAKRDYEATFRVACFAQAPAVFAIVPFCGSAIQFVYHIVLLIIGISEAHQVSRWTAAGAVLLPIVIGCCCCGASLGALFGGLAGISGFPR